MSELEPPADPVRHPSRFTPRQRSVVARWIAASLVLHGAALAALGAWWSIGGQGDGACASDDCTPYDLPEPLPAEPELRPLPRAADPAPEPLPDIPRPAGDPEPSNAVDATAPIECDWHAPAFDADRASFGPGTIGVGPRDRWPNARLRHGVARTGGAVGAPIAAAPVVAMTVAPRGATHAPCFAAPPEPPVYPRTARRHGWEGVVRLRVEVAADGAVSAVSVLATSGRDVLDEAAVDAARTWRFAPARDDGAAVAGSMDVPVRFRLQE